MSSEQILREEESIKYVREYFGKSTILNKAFGIIHGKLSRSREKVDSLRDYDAKEICKRTKMDEKDLTMLTIVETIKSYLYATDSDDDAPKVIRIASMTAKTMATYVTLSYNDMLDKVRNNRTTMTVARKYTKKKSIVHDLDYGDDYIVFKSEFIYPFCMAVFNILEGIGIFECTKSYKNKLITGFILDEDMRKFFIDHFHKVSVSRPMLCPPKPWLSNFGGGFLKGKQHIIRNCDKPHLKVGQVELDAINRLQETSFSVDEKMLEVAQYVVANKLFINKKHDFSKEESPYGKKNTGPIQNRNRARMAFAEAKDLVGKEFYFVHRIDKRGRKYPESCHLNYHMSDMYRSLLRFGKKKKLGESGEYWLFQYCASLYGHKGSMQERFDDFLSMEEHMIRIADGWMNLEWTSAGDSFRFLQACFEVKALREWVDGGGLPCDFESNLIYTVDGSCNGFQHLSVLTRDIKAMKSVNLIPSTYPCDIYSDVLGVVKGMNVTGDESFPEEIYTRDLSKKCVMTIPYGSTIQGKVFMLEDYFYKYHKGANNLTYINAAKYFSRAFDEVVNAMYPDMMNGLRAIRKSVHAYAKNSDLVWTSPSGVPVDFNYKETEDFRMRMIGECLFYRRTLDSTSATQTANASIANFIHSIDASHLSMVVNSMDTDFVSVHDEFGCHLGDASRMYIVIREEFVKLHESNILNSYLEELENDVLSFDATPTYLDVLNGVIRSDFMFM